MLNSDPPGESWPPGAGELLEIGQSGTAESPCALAVVGPGGQRSQAVKGSAGAGHLAQGGLGATGEGQELKASRALGFGSVAGGATGWALES